MSATIYDVAREAGVSASTVSHVINGTRRVEAETRERVQEAIARLGYQRNALANALASGLRGRRMRTLGLLLPEMSNPISVDMARGVEAVAGDAGYGLFLCNTDAQPKKQRAYIRMLLEHQVAGILVNPVDDTAEDVARLHERGIPLVQLGYKVASPPLDSVRLDYAMGGRQAVEHLVSRGHRHILALLANPDADHPVTAERRRGFEAALREAGIEPDPALELATANQVDEAREAVLGLLAKGSAGGAVRGKMPFTAAVGFMPGVTLGLLAALRERGLSVPDDVSVVGFGDAEWMRAFPPPITAVDQPNYDVGREAATLLLGRIAERERCAAEEAGDHAAADAAAADPEIRYVTTRLIERESVAPPG
ncbi:MAG TPA: LacI family DNA-binding transcriptional regulator [Chloroflexota bacterium]|nr:LacI family DNA-binding transcriptional regulator [Chloroflexota bacterium]